MFPGVVIYGEDYFQFFIHGISWQKKVQVFKLFGEGAFDRFLYMRRIHDFLVRCFRSVVAFDGFRSNPFYCDEFY
jgi:hypothetical protein